MVGGELGLGADPGGLGWLTRSSRMGVEIRAIGTAAEQDKQAGISVRHEKQGRGLAPGTLT